MKKALFIDFEDSFSFNVIQELKDLNLMVEVISWKDFEDLPGGDLLVLGPGPGHPDDYSIIFSIVESWLNEHRPFLGVCLGHQIFWRIMGEEIVRSKNPLHGQKIELNLSPDWQNELELPSFVSVQRYNSLCIEAPPEGKYSHLQNLTVDGEVMITRGKNVITYQFHPESVGTSFRSAFFAPVIHDLS